MRPGDEDDDETHRSIGVPIDACKRECEWRCSVGAVEDLDLCLDGRQRHIASVDVAGCEYTWAAQDAGCAGEVWSQRTHRLQ